MEFKHFNAKLIFMEIAHEGGPNFFTAYCRGNNIHCGDHLCYYFYDWDYINEFYTREWALWWELFSRITGIGPGDNFYLDF